MKHTHIFRGATEFALEHFGRERVERILGPDVIIAHGNGLTPPEVEVVGGRQCNVASVPSTGENIQYGYCPTVELLKAGANVTIATDGNAPYMNFDLWSHVVRAMWHQWIAHSSQLSLPAGKALRMITIDAARALGMDHEVGSLEVGKKADVVLIDFNRPHLTPMTFVPQLLTFYMNGNDVDTVLVDGKVLMEGKQVLTVDVQDVMEMASEEAERAFGLIDPQPYVRLDHDFWHGPGR